MIPKIIWQTHEAEYDDLKPFQKSITNTWKNLNPDWEYRYVSKKIRDKYVKEFDDFLYSCYLELSGVNQADLFKMLIIYKYGGFYADMDSVCSMPLNNVLSRLTEGKEIVCSSPGYQANEYDVNCSNFGAIANSKNFAEIVDIVINEYKKIQHEKKVELKNLNPGIPTWITFNRVNGSNTKTILFDESYFIHSEKLKTEFEDDYKVNYNDQVMPYLEFIKINNLPI